jgi:LysM repeat protein
MLVSRLTLSALLKISLSLVLLCALSSCKTKDSSLTNDPYVSSDEGGYNPYPGSDSTVSSDSLLPQETIGSSYVPQYEQAVPPPPSGFTEPSSSAPRTPTYTTAPRKTTPSSSKPKTTVAKAKPKTTSKSTASKTKPKTVAKTTKKPIKKTTKPAAKVHTVVKGDTLYGLALKNKTTVAKIKAANGLSSDKLSIGKKLRIP